MATMPLILKRVSRAPVFSIAKLWLFLHPYASGPKLSSSAGVTLYLNRVEHVSINPS